MFTHVFNLKGKHVPWLWYYMIRYQCHCTYELCHTMNSETKHSFIYTLNSYNLDIFLLFICCEFSSTGSSVVVHFLNLVYNVRILKRLEKVKS